VRHQAKASTQRRRRRALGLALLIACALVALASAAPASAAPPLLWQSGEVGSGAGQLEIPRGIAVAPEAAPNRGHVFIVDQENNRVVELTTWGVFVKTWGWDVVETGPGDDTTAPEDQFEICVPANGDVCRRGQLGSSSGQFGFAAQGVAVDSNGNVYVVDRANHRVQKFDPAGNFILMFGGDVNKTKADEAAPEAQRNICTAASGDVCQAGTEGTGNGQFGTWLIVGSYIAVGPGDRIYVGDVGRIQYFNTSGEVQGQVAANIGPAERVRSLAVGPTGIVYAAFEGQKDVRRWSSFPTHEPLSSITVSGLAAPFALAVDSDQNLYVLGSGLIRKLDSSGVPVESWGQEEPSAPKLGSDLTGIVASSACLNAGADIYVSNFGELGANSFVRAYGPPPDFDLCEPPPLVAPVIDDQYAVSVGTDSALVRARINPEFWDDTTYYVEYGTSECSSGGCEEREPVSAETLTEEVTNASQVAAANLTAGLEPGTKYHYRFVAESSGGGPVFGIDPDGDGPQEASLADGLEATFTTPPLPQPEDTNCSNQAFRAGASAFLPNCRAFEMVSPVDKNGDGINTLFEINSSQIKATHDQSAGVGDGITYSSKQSFGDAIGGSFSSQYLSRRIPGVGWSTHSLSAPHEGFAGIEATTLDSEFKLFSEDLSEAWMLHGANPPLAPCAPLDSTVLYRRDNAEDSYEALHCEPNIPRFFQARDTIELQGVSADGCRSVFRSKARLTADAVGPVAGKNELEQPYQLYESSCESPVQPEGPLRLISRLPNGSACQKEGATVVSATAGTLSVAGPIEYNDGRSKQLLHAFSSDAHRLYWSCGNTLYLRTDPDLTVEGDEDVVEVAKTSCKAAGVCAPPRFQAAAADGARMLFTRLTPAGYELTSYDAQTKEITPIASEIAENNTSTIPVSLLGASEDATHAYLVSTEVCSGGQENSEGDVAVNGEPNLYLYEAGEECGASDLTFVATLSRKTDFDFEVRSRSSFYPRPYFHTARVSPDGLHAVFMSAGQLTGFDNTDLGNGKADMEVFVFNAGANGGTGELDCVSCNPTGVRPQGRILAPDGTWAAAWIPGWQSSFYPGRSLSEDGRRLFFNSFEALVDRDTNDRQDVYQWEQVDSEGKAAEAECKAKGNELYVASAGGCLSLISSGQDPVNSEFIDADKDGSDVFIRTNESLVGQDPGLGDVYDARIGGGVPEPPAPKPPCEGEACQSPPPAPEFSAPASSAFHAPEGSAEKPRPRCRKGKVRRRGRCVAKAKHRHRQAANRRAQHERGRAAR
jgi:DNA-binding beta-propeller fold protein YncE